MGVYIFLNYHIQELSKYSKSKIDVVRYPKIFYYINRSKMDALPNELYFKCYKKLYIIEKHIAYNLKSDSSCNAIMPIDQKLLTVGSVICTAVM